MNEKISTYSEASEMKPLTLEELKAAASKVVVGSTGKGKRKGGFERLMNRFGWYRSSEWYLIDTSKMFNGWPNWKAPVIKDPPKPDIK